MRVREIDPSSRTLLIPSSRQRSQTAADGLAIRPTQNGGPHENAPRRHLAGPRPADRRHQPVRQLGHRHRPQSDGRTTSTRPSPRSSPVRRRCGRCRPTTAAGFSDGRRRSWPSASRTSPARSAPKRGRSSPKGASRRAGRRTLSTSPPTKPAGWRGGRPARRRTGGGQPAGVHAAGAVRDRRGDFAVQLSAAPRLPQGRAGDCRGECRAHQAGDRHAAVGSEVHRNPAGSRPAGRSDRLPHRPRRRTGPGDLRRRPRAEDQLHRQLRGGQRDLQDGRHEEGHDGTGQQQPGDRDGRRRPGKSRRRRRLRRVRQRRAGLHLGPADSHLAARSAATSSTP